MDQVSVGHEGSNPECYCQDKHWCVPCQQGQLHPKSFGPLESAVDGGVEPEVGVHVPDGQTDGARDAIASKNIMCNLHLNHMSERKPNVYKYSYTIKDSFAKKVILS